jgi:hypothetical protein
MVEKQLEAAYRQRIEGRRQRHRELREMHEELSTRHISAADQDIETIVALEGFWELPKGTRPENPVRQRARSVFGGEPDHPVTGQPMA